MSTQDAPCSAAWAMEWQAYDQPPQRRIVAAPAEAAAVFNDVDAEGSPVLIEVFPEGRDGPFLCVAAGGVRSVATWQDSLDPPYYSSLGQDEAGAEAFAYGGQESEFAPRHLIDKTDAVRALREVLATDSRPGAITWEEV